MWWHTVTHRMGSEGETGEWSGLPVLFTLPRNMVYPALLQLMRTPRLPVVDWTDAQFKWTRPFRRKTESGFCACAITFQKQSTGLSLGKGAGARLKKEYSSISASVLCLHGRLLGEFFVTFTLLKVIDMVLLLISSHEKLVECTLSVPHITPPCGKYRLWRTFLSIFSHEKLVECTLSLPHITLPCGKYGLWRTFLSISVYLNKHHASYNSWLIANSPKSLNVYWQYLHNAHGTGLCNLKITPHILLSPCLY